MGQKSGLFANQKPKMGQGSKSCLDHFATCNPLLRVEGHALARDSRSRTDSENASNGDQCWNLGNIIHAGFC